MLFGIIHWDEFTVAVVDPDEGVVDILELENPTFRSLKEAIYEYDPTLFVGDQFKATVPFYDVVPLHERVVKE